MGAFTTASGRLRTGRIALIVFLGILLAAALVFKAAKPIDQAVIAVKHVFEPQEKPAKPSAPVKSTETPGPETPGPEKTEPEKKKQLTTAEKIENEAPAPMKDQASSSPKRQEESIEKSAGEKESLAEEQVPALAEKTVDSKKNTVTVDKQQYLQLFKAWRNSGQNEPPEGQTPDKITLRVENLREVYELFQMKPVVKFKGLFIDLENNTRIPEEALSQYSNTVFLVDDPWSKWEAELAAAGIKKTEAIDVRYYMYGFVRNAIYARAGKAFAWSRAHELTAQQINPADAEISGKAFVINQDGGGKFGVFVPLTMALKDGRTTSISPTCFQGEKDVETLITAGLL